MISKLVLAALAAAGYSLASPLSSKPYTCQQFSVNIAVDNVTTVVPYLPEIESQEQATHYADILTTRKSPGSVAPQFNLTSLSKTFTIVGDYCTPANPGSNADIVHVLTHGIGFNRSYWDFYLPSNSDPQYSYIYAATSAGYSTISWNRLGIFPSTVADPYTEIQDSVELAVLTELTKLVVDGSADLNLPAPPSKVLHVGHSFGSQLSKALGIHTPELTDGIVLTGFIDTQLGQSDYIASTSLHLVNTNQPARFPPSQYSNGFLTWPDAYANQYSFLAWPSFDSAVLAQAEATKYPFTLGEFLSGSTIASPNSSTFAGPVYYVASELDLIFCESNCTGVVGVDVPATRDTWPRADLEVDIIAGAGHALNLHYQAADAYQKIMQWVGEKF